MATTTTKKYYDYSVTTNTPQILKAVFEQIREYMAGIIYTQESLSVGISRFVLADMVEAGWNPKAAAQFNSANLKFPFTAYNMGEPSFAKEFRSYAQVSGHMYNSNVGKLIKSVPMRMTFPMITFYDNPDDYRIGLKLLYTDVSELSRTYKSVTLNGYTAVVPIVLNFEIAKGTYASEFTEQLRAGNIWDIQHNVTAYFQEFTLLGTGESEIESMLTNVKRWAEVNIGASETAQSVTGYADPIIVSSTPSNGQTSFPVSSGVVLNFNVSMDESAVEAGVTLYPYFENNVSWDIDSKTLTINPIVNLTSGTTYSLTFDENCKAFYNDSTLSSGIISFTTVV